MKNVPLLGKNSNIECRIWSLVNSRKELDNTFYWWTYQYHQTLERNNSISSLKKFQWSQATHLTTQNTGTPIKGRKFLLEDREQLIRLERQTSMPISLLTCGNNHFLVLTWHIMILSNINELPLQDYFKPFTFNKISFFVLNNPLLLLSFFSTLCTGGMTCFPRYRHRWPLFSSPDWIFDFAYEPYKFF